MQWLRRCLQALFASAVLAVGLIAVPTAAHASNCPINIGGYSGAYICEYGTIFNTWPNGHGQYWLSERTITSIPSGRIRLAGNGAAGLNSAV